MIYNPSQPLQGILSFKVYIFKRVFPWKALKGHENMEHTFVFHDVGHVTRTWSRHYFPSKTDTSAYKYQYNCNNFN